MNSPQHESMSDAAAHTGETLSAIARPLLGAVTSVVQTESTLRPGAFREVTPDAVLICVRPDGQRYRLVVEVQLHRDDTKRIRWPWYLGLVERRDNARAILLILAPDQGVRDWIDDVMSHDPGLKARSFVAGPEQVPRLTDLSPAQRTASAAYWSAAMHLTESPDDDLLRLALDPALAGQDAFESRERYLELLCAVVPNAYGAQIEERIMEWQSQGEATSGSRIPTIAEYFRDEGREQGREQGREEGRKEGRAKVVATARSLFLRSLKLSGLELLPAQQVVVEACSDPEQFEVWLDRLAAGESVESVVAAPRS